MKIAAVIQARMNSTRLPGKVLRPILGQPLLWHVVHRLKKSRLINEIAVATSTNPADDPLAAYAHSLGVRVVRGQEDDVLGRFLLAADMLDPDIIVRVCGDSPLIDSDLVDHMISEMLKTRADFVTLKADTPCIHEGVDPMSRRALETLRLEARNDPVAREHVSAYFKIHPNLVRVAVVDLDARYQFTGARISVDTPADIEFIEAVHNRLRAQAGEASLTDLVALLKRDRSLLAINSHVKQKAPSAVSGMVLIRCDGGPEKGFGHVRRCLALGKALRDKQGLGVVFAMARNDAANAMVREAGFGVELPPEGADDDSWTSMLIAVHAPKALVLDVRTDVDALAVEGFKNQGTYVVVIDDGSPRRLSADLAIYPPVPQAFAFDWSGSECECVIGWEWTMLGAEVRNRTYREDWLPRILVTMGGSDPWGWTIPAVKALTELPERCPITVVLGPGFTDVEKTMTTLRGLDPNINVFRSPRDVSLIMVQSDIAVTAFGVSAPELAAHGVPCVYLCPTEDHALSASAYSDAGFGMTLGEIKQLDPKAVQAAVRYMLDHPEERRQMGAAARLHMDGRGAERVAALITQRLQVKNQKVAPPMPAKAPAA